MRVAEVALTITISLMIKRRLAINI